MRDEELLGGDGVRTARLGEGDEEALAYLVRRAGERAAHELRKRCVPRAAARRMQRAVARNDRAPLALAQPLARFAQRKRRWAHPIVTRAKYIPLRHARRKERRPEDAMGG